MGPAASIPRRRGRAAWLALGAALTLVACAGDTAGTSRPPDGGALDAGPLDTGPPDAAFADAPRPADPADAPPPPDAAPDALVAAPDAPLIEAPDAALADAALPDAPLAEEPDAPLAGEPDAPLSDPDANEVDLPDAPLSPDSPSPHDAQPSLDAPLPPDAAAAPPPPDAAPPPDVAAPDAPPITAFRMTELALRDPHLLINDCRLDATDTFFGVNPLIAEALVTPDERGLLELSPVLLFRPLRTGATVATEGELVFADCTAPPTTTCSATMLHGRHETTFQNQGAGECLGVVPGTASTGAVYAPGYPPIGVTRAGARPCFVSEPMSILLGTVDFRLPLVDARVAAVYDADAASGLVSGLLRGTLREADAEQVVVPFLGGSLNQYLWGGFGNTCPDPVPGDRDGPGWIFYFNFKATRVPYSER
jgi:hypothetical protein